MSRTNLALRHRKALERALYAELLEQEDPGVPQAGRGNEVRLAAGEGSHGCLTHHVFRTAPLPQVCFFLMGIEGVGYSASWAWYLRTSFYLISCNIKGGREGPQLCTWPQGSTPVQTVTKYLEVEEKSDPERRESTGSLGGFPLMSTSRWPSGRYPSSLTH